MIKKIFLILALVLVTAVTVDAKKVKDDGKVPEYQIEGAGVGETGMDLVKVYVITENSDIADLLIGRAAVHGVLFKGYAAERNRTKKPLARTALTETEHADFFEAFFKPGGGHENYIQLVGNERDRTKVGKKQYKIGATVRVSSAQLRKDLEKQGILKALGAGF